MAEDVLPDYHCGLIKNRIIKFYWYESSHVNENLNLQITHTLSCITTYKQGTVLFMPSGVCQGLLFSL